MYQYNSRNSARHNNQVKRSFQRPRSKGRQPKKDYIHPSRFIKSAKPQSKNTYTPIHKFQDFNLCKLLKHNLEAMGFSTPSPIQDQTIPLGLTGKNVVGIASTGTGKTAAFAIPILNKLITDPDSKAIVLAPTRELALQIEQECRRIGKGSSLNGALLIGGVAMGPQLRDLSFNPKIIIGTPGRVKDHLERGSLIISDCNLVVLDEVDRMLDMGFVHDIKQILSRVNTTRQNFYFSATLDNRVKGIIESFSKDTVHISIKSGEASENVEQNVISYTEDDKKIEKLHDVLIDSATIKTLIFDDTHRSVEKLAKELALRGFLTDAIHGGKTQSQRQRALKKFKTNEVTVLVATDVAARGLDVSDITHVINYSQPQTYEDYIHRIGRTGRAGRAGFALTFVEK